MKIMMRLTAAALALGMLGAAACSSCSQPTDDGSASSAVTQPTSYRCGAGTVQQGNQCVATTSATSSSSTRPKTQTINTSGNN